MKFSILNLVIFFPMILPSLNLQAIGQARHWGCVSAKRTGVLELRLRSWASADDVSLLVLLLSIRSSVYSFTVGLGHRQFHTAFSRFKAAKSYTQSERQLGHGRNHI